MPEPGSPSALEEEVRPLPFGIDLIKNQKPVGCLRIGAEEVKKGNGLIAEGYDNIMSLLVKGSRSSKKRSKL